MESTTWSWPPNRLPPEMTIDVWVVRLDTPDENEACLDGALSEEERRRARRLSVPPDALRFRLCRATLRVALAWYLQETPDRVRLTTSSRGKPGLRQATKLHFNVAHSGGLAMIAFTTLGEVGIDVEAVRHDIAFGEIASANFTKPEAALVAAKETPQDQAFTFFRLWTRKEAVLKAAGYGISGGLDAVDVSKEPVVWLRGVEGESGGSCWTVRDLEPPEGFLGAVAGPAGNWSVRQWPCRAEDAIRRLVKSLPSPPRSRPLISE